MSRGGRGGYGRGRGGGGKQRIGGQEVAWDYDPELEVDNKPQELFPKIQVPQARPAAKIERAQIERYKAFRRSVHEGPFYTVIGDDVRITKPGGSIKRAQIDPFEDMPSYTQKYKPTLRKLPRFESKRYELLRFFPKELWTIVDPKSGSRYKREIAHGINFRSRKRNHLAIGDEDDDETEKKDKLDEENPDFEDEEDEAASEKNPEDDFSEDDSDMGADYNAEGYFDAGDDDFDAADMNGGEEGGFD